MKSRGLQRKGIAFDALVGSLDMGVSFLCGPLFGVGLQGNYKESNSFF